MRMKFLFSLSILICGLCACSAYQSEGRKFLEKQAYEYAGVQSHLVSCQNTNSIAGANLVFSEQRASVYSTDGQPLAIRVVPSTGPAFSCDYGFANGDELTHKLTGAIEYTLHQMAK